MIRIAEKLGFMKVQAVKVCAKAWIGRKAEHKNSGFRVNVRQNCLREEES